MPGDRIVYTFIVRASCHWFFRWKTRFQISHNHQSRQCACDSTITHICTIDNTLSNSNCLKIQYGSRFDVRFLATEFICWSLCSDFSIIIFTGVCVMKCTESVAYWIRLFVAIFHGIILAGNIIYINRKHR